jgi:succinate dehydrogenase/fumarate reductase-like Fe-S protein
LAAVASSIFVKIFRFEPDKDAAGWFQDYVVESAEPLSVMALLAKIHEVEPAFACRTSTCFKGKCGSCLVRVNGQDVLGCVTLVKPGEAIVVEPHSKFAVIRDIVVDFSQPLVKGVDCE